MATNRSRLDRVTQLRRVASIALVVSLVLLVLSAGCGGPKEVVPPASAGADKFLYERGLAALKNKKWVDARQYFIKLIDGYPQSTYRADAKIGIGDVYLAEGTSESRVLAQNEFREFLTYYPTNPRADYAQYKLGMTHFGAMPSPGRDQTETKAAIKEFEIFLPRYPSSALIGDVRARLREAKDHLGLHEFGIGLFYYRTRWYPGAVARFKDLLSSDPEYTNRDAVYFYLAETLLKAENKAEALPYYDRLVGEFQSSEYLDEARKRIAELRPERGQAELKP